ncbi:MAG: VOC family protein [Candidatus Micrarchaeia archaeon]
MNPVNWFEIPVEDVDRAKAFYEAVFGVTLSRQDLGELQMVWFPMVQGAQGSSGSLVKGKSYKPSHSGSLVYFSVKDIDATLEKVKANGGKVIRGKMDIGQYGYVGHFEDTEGNRVALHQNK